LDRQDRLEKLVHLGSCLIVFLRKTYQRKKLLRE